LRPTTLPTTLSVCHTRLFLLRSIRPRTTLLITALVALFAVPTYVQEEMLTGHVENDTAWVDLQRQATMTASIVRSGRARDPVRPDIRGVDFIQVVGPDRRVLAATAAARGLAPMTDVWPSASAPQQNLHTCVSQRLGCVYVTALRVDSTPGSAVVYAARSATGAERSRWLFALQAAALIVLAAWAVWKIIGRLLCPIEAIRATLTTINSNNLSCRVPEPRGNDEVVMLARTINGTLDRLEEAKEVSERALAQQRRFACDASHELRTPLAGLRVLLEEAELHPDETALPDLLRDALSDVDRLQRITTDLLLLSRVEAGTPIEWEAIDLSRLVREEIALRSDRLPVRMRLESDTTVRGCRIQMARVLTNLLDNAQRHATHRVDVDVRRECSVAVLAVSDDGTGIAGADRERIFERFTRLDAARSRDQGGTGLGLAIARDIAQAHQGTLTAGCSDMGGARFVMRLPLAGTS
jgi:signal transduction histidine kinase